jgi:hypothetical protein
MPSTRPNNPHAARIQERIEDQNHVRSVPTSPPDNTLLDVFDLDDEPLEPEPEYGDFWEEFDDDCNNRG